MAYYITRVQGMSQAVNTMAAMTLDAEGATVAAPTVPQGVSGIKQLIVAISASIVAVASAGVTIQLRLSGNGLVQGQQDISIGTLREDTTSTAGAKILPSQVFDVDIPTTQGNQVGLALAMDGVDPGTPRVSVTLVFA